MAKPLPDRIRAALSAGSRAQTIADLIGEIENEHLPRHAKAAEQAEAEAVDPFNGAAEQDEAGERAKTARTEVTRLEAALKALREKHSERVSSERAIASRAEYDAARTERDQIAADLAVWWSQHMPALIDVLQRASASNQRIEVVNRAPTGPRLDTAEAVARGLPSHQIAWGGSIPSLLLWKIPSWNSSTHIWPPQRRAADYSGEWEASKQAADRIKAAETKTEAERRAKFARYRLSEQPGRGVFFHEQTPDGESAPREIAYCPEAWLHDNEAARLRGIKGVKVERIEEAQ